MCHYCFNQTKKFLWTTRRIPDIFCWLERVCVFFVRRPPWWSQLNFWIAIRLDEAEEEIRSIHWLVRAFCFRIRAGISTQWSTLRRRPLWPTILFSLFLCGSLWVRVLLFWRAAEEFHQKGGAGEMECESVARSASCSKWCRCGRRQYLHLISLPRWVRFGPLPSPAPSLPPPPPPTDRYLSWSIRGCCRRRIERLRSLSQSTRHWLKPLSTPLPPPPPLFFFPWAHNNKKRAAATTFSQEIDPKRFYRSMERWFDDSACAFQRATQPNDDSPLIWISDQVESDSVLLVSGWKQWLHRQEAVTGPSGGDRWADFNCQKRRFKRKEGRRQWFTDVMRSSLSSFSFVWRRLSILFFLRRVRARASEREGREKKKRSAESNEQSTRSTSGGAAVSSALYFFLFFCLCMCVCSPFFSIYLFITLRHRTATVQSHRQLAD